MKKTRFILTVLVGLFTMTSLHAQIRERNYSTSTLGLGVDFALPTGKFNDKVNFGAGGSLLFMYPISESFSITGNVGYIRFIGEKVLKNIRYREGYVPIKAGARAFLFDNFFGSAELGAAISTANGNGNGTAFIYTPGVGLQLPMPKDGSLDIGLRYENWYRTSGTRSFIGARVGYNF